MKVARLLMFRRGDEMQKTFFCADRAVALGDVRQVGGDAKSNSPAMAAAFERSHALRLLSSQLIRGISQQGGGRRRHSIRSASPRSMDRMVGQSALVRTKSAGVWSEPDQE